MKQNGATSVTLYSEFPLAFYGGGEEVILTVSNYLKNRGLSCTVVENSCVRSQLRVSNDFIKSKLECEVISECFHKTGFTRYFRVWFPDMGAVGNNCTSLLIVRRIPGINYLKKLVDERQKVVFCIHGIALEDFRIANPLIMFHQILLRLQLKRLSRFLYDGSRIYAQTITLKQSEFLLNRGASPKRVFLIENGAWTDTGWPKRNDETFQVVFMGRIENLSKGINTLRNVVQLSFAREMEFKFVIIGSGGDEKMLSNLPRNAQFLSFVNEEKRSEVLESSNLMLVTSNFSLSDLSAIEALLNGLPLVTTPTSGLTEIISKDELYGKISTFRPRDLVSAIDSFYSAWKNNKAKYFEIKTQIAEKAKKTFEKGGRLSEYFKLVEKVSSNDSISSA